MGVKGKGACVVIPPAARSKSNFWVDVYDLFSNFLYDTLLYVVF